MSSAIFDYLFYRSFFFWTVVLAQFFFSLSDQGGDTRLFGCIAVNVSSGNASLHEFPCDTKLTPLCEPGIYTSAKTFLVES